MSLYHCHPVSHLLCVPAGIVLLLQNSLFPTNNSEAGSCLEYGSLSCRDLRIYILNPSDGLSLLARLQHKNNESFCYEHVRFLSLALSISYSHTHTHTYTSSRQSGVEGKDIPSPILSPPWLFFISLISERKRMRNTCTHI